MNILFLMISILLVSSVVFTHLVFAKSYDINMPTGSSSPEAPYFWQNEKSGLATGDIEISVGDSVVWQNADQANHTVVSGTPSEGPDGIFGSSDLLAPGKSFQFQFDKKGQYPYYCILHPWMTGTVFVTDGYKTIPKVGKTIDDGTKVFDVEYHFDRLLSLVAIDKEQKLLTFEIVGRPQSDDRTLKIRLPSDLIEGPFVIIVDGKKITHFEESKDNEIDTISITMPDDSKLLSVMGTTIVPEFGTFPIIVLAIASLSIILWVRKFPIGLKSL